MTKAVGLRDPMKPVEAPLVTNVGAPSKTLREFLAARCQRNGNITVNPVALTI